MSCGGLRRIALLCLATMLLSGCLADVQLEPRLRVDADAAGTVSTDLAGAGANTGVEQARGAGWRVKAALVVQDMSSTVLGPGSRASVRIAVALEADAPAPLEGTLTTRIVDADGVELATARHVLVLGDPVPPSALDAMVELDAGRHNVTAHTTWEPDQRAAEPLPAATAPIHIHAGIPYHLNASHAWQPEQKTFDTQLLAPYLPWTQDDGAAGQPSGLGLLENASAWYGFPIHVPYRDDYDASYILAINGTEETWCDIGACSHSWMIHVDDELADRAIDHIRLGPDQHLELRYMRCDAAARCSDPGPLD